jgi:hypothetical protein
MTHHFFSVGEHVIYSEPGLSGVICAGEYEVRGLLVGDGERPQYQLTCADQSHHRVVSEHEIRPMAVNDGARHCDEGHSFRRQRPMLTDPALLEL